MNNQWNSDVITPEGEAGSTPIATNGGLDVNGSGELEVKVDGSTIDINSSGELEAIGGGAVYEAGEGIVINGDTISADETVLATKAELGSYATTESVTAGLSAKQDVIDDLTDIRSGATAGSTAVQPSGLAPYATTASMNTALAGKQDVISDLSTIRSGAEAGATALQPGALDDYVTDSDLSTALSSKQDTISDLGTIRAGAAAGATAVQSADLAPYATTSAVETALAGKQDVISDLSTIRSGAEAGATALQPGALDNYVTSTQLNTGLAGKQDVLTAGSNITISNGTISAVDTTYTAGANITIENGVISATDGDTRYSAGNGIDIDANNEISVDTTVVATQTDLASKQDTISDLATIRSGAAAGATAVQPGSLATVATTGSYNDLSDKPTIPPGVVVDQTYDGTSTNAQSGTAVAQAIAAIPAPQVSGIVEEFDWATVSYSDINTCLANGNTPVMLYDRFNDGDVLRAELSETISIGNVVSHVFRTGVRIGALDVMVQSGGVTKLTINSANGKLVDDYEAINARFTVDSTLNLTQPNPSSNTLQISVVNPIPASTSSDENKVLTVNASGNAAWATPATVTVDQTYNASSANAQSGTAVAGAIATKQDTISDLATIRSGASAGATAVQPSSLATVATTGDYDDLTNKPTIPVVPSTKPVVAGVNVTITDGANNVTIAATDTTYTAGNGLTLSSGAFSVDTSVVATQSDLSSYTPTASLATVATTGDYGDLSNRPTIPTVDQSYNASSTNAQSGAAVAGALAGLTIPVIGTVTIPDPTPSEPSEPEPSGDLVIEEE